MELTYTSRAMTPFALDLGFDGPPFRYVEERRAHIRADLDAFFARAYGLDRNELRYILDPSDVMGSRLSVRDLSRAQAKGNPPVR